MDLADIEGDARDLLRMARLDPDDAHSIRAMCMGLTGAPPIVTPLIATEGRVSLVQGQLRVVVSSKLRLERQRWVAGHELAHVYYRRAGHESGALEARCDLLGAILVAPRRVVQEARRNHGDNPRAIASDIGVTQAIALLRLGEIGAVDGAALATSTRVVARGEIAWPDAHALRTAIRKGIPNGKLVKITDEVNRRGLIVFG